MNPSSGGEAQPHFEMPIPSQDGGELQHDQAQEHSAPAESSVGRAQPQLTPAPVAPVVAQLVVDDSQLPVVAPAKPLPTDDLTAADVHVIEKQWVNKAKQIIAQNQDDPFAQKHEISRVKADYIKKRYSKTIPTDDPVDKTQPTPEQGRTGEPIAV